jgi:hypothetical protein
VARWLVAPTLLVAIALQQIVLVHTTHLTPWKGGGFGMFSTDQTGGNRVVRVYLVARVGGELRQLAVLPPAELEPVHRALRRTATTTEVDRFAGQLARLPWREPAELDAIVAAGPQALAEGALAARDGTGGDLRLAGLLRLPRAWAGGLPSTKRHGNGRAVGFDRVLVEVWELRYRPATHEMRAERLIESWADRPTPRRRSAS